MNPVIRFFIIAFGLALGLEMNPAHAAEAKFPLSNTDILIYAWQEEIGTATRSTDPMAAGGGLLGAIITSSLDHRANKKAEEAVADLRDRLIEYRHSRVFADKLVSDVDWERVAYGATPRLQTVRTNVEEQDPLESPRLEILPEVLFTNDLNTLVVRINAALINPPKRPNAKPKLARMERYEFAWPVGHLRQRAKRDAASQAWSSLPAEELIQLIELGMDTAIELWNFRMGNPVLPEGTGRWNPLYTADVQAGSKIDERGDLIWLKRTRRGGWLYAVHRDVFRKPDAEG